MKSKFWFERHLSEEYLIGWLDGELNGLSAHRGARHLKSCWTCRRRCELLRQSMDRFIEFHERLMAAPHAQPSRDWSDFDSRLRLTAASLPARKKINWSGRARTIFAPAAVVLSMGLVMWLTEARHLSATEIYARTAQVERETLTRAGRSVIVREFRVESSRRTAHLAVWHAPSLKKTHSFWGAGSDVSLQREVQRIYSEAGLQLGDPLSASNHSRWESSLAHSTESVEKDSSLLRVITRNADQPRGEIIQAEFVVRSADWHPVEERFKVGGAGGEEDYRIIETGYRVENSDAELARMYGILSGERLNPADPQPVTTAKVIAAGAVPPLVVPESAFTTLDAEVEALADLHEIQADRQEAATVQTVDGRVVVTVYIANDERRAVIENRLSEVPLVRLVVHSLSGRPELPPGAPPVSEITAAAVPTGSPGTPPFAKALAEQAGSMAAANDMVSQRLDSLANVGVQLRAMEMLATRFPEPLRNSLSAVSRRRLDDLASDHLESARRTWRELELSSGPFKAAMGLLQAPSDPGPGVAACGKWYQAVDLAAATSRLEDLFARGFTTISGEPGADSSVTKESIRGGMEQLSADLSRALAAGCLR